MMAETSQLEEAMVVIQEASAAITEVSHKLNALQNNNDGVITALKDLTNKVSQLESQSFPSSSGADSKVKPPLYIRVGLRERH